MHSSLRIEENSVCRYRKIDGDGIRVIWELTGRCNLKCRHCFASVTSEKNLSAKELNAQEAISVIEQFKDAKVAKVMLTGGEVFVRDDIMQIIRAIRERCKDIVIDITTNALLINNDVISELKKAMVDELTISLDGPEKVYHMVRGKKANYEHLLTNIRMLVNKGILVDGIMVLNKLTYAHIEETVTLAANMGFSSFTIANLEQLPHSNFDYEGIKLTSEELEKSIQNIEILKNKYRESLIIRTTGFINCFGVKTCTNKSIVAIDRNGMYCHCLNVYENNEIRLDSRKIPLKEAIRIINTGMLN